MKMNTKKSMKIIASILAAISMISTVTIPISAAGDNGDGSVIQEWNNPADDTLDDLMHDAYTGWKTTSTEKVYYKNGKMLKSKWLVSGSKRYYFKKDGTMAVGSMKIKNIAYKFNADGVLVTDGSHVYDKKGNRLTEKQAASSKSTYVLENGRLVNNKYFIVRSTVEDDINLREKLEKYGFKCEKLEDGKYKAFFPRQLTVREINAVIKKLKADDVVTSIYKSVKKLDM